MAANVSLDGEKEVHACYWHLYKLFSSPLGRLEMFIMTYEKYADPLD